MTPPQVAAVLMPRKARLVRRDLAATAALFARSIHWHLAKHDLKTSCAAPVTSKGDHMLSDGEDQEERAPTPDLRGSGSGGIVPRGRAERGFLAALVTQRQCPGIQPGIKSAWPFGRRGPDSGAVRCRADAKEGRYQRGNYLDSC